MSDTPDSISHFAVGYEVLKLSDVIKCISGHNSALYLYLPPFI